MSPERDHINHCPSWISRDDWAGELILARLELLHRHAVEPDPRSVRAYAHRRARAIWRSGAFADDGLSAIEHLPGGVDPLELLILSETLAARTAAEKSHTESAQRLADLFVGRGYRELARDWGCSRSTAHARVQRMRSCLAGGQLEMEL